MVNQIPLIHRDLNHIWHPCTQMKDFEQFPPLHVHRAKGSYLYTDHGEIIDAISSWWCKSLGHNHPRVMAAIHQQAQTFEHVIGAGTTHESIVALAEELAEITQLQHVFFASEGSSAVEIALKMALQACVVRGEPQKNKFIALKNGYHGETLGAMSVSDLGIYKEPFSAFGYPCHFLQHIPYVLSPNDPLWNDCEYYWQKTRAELEAIKHEVCAIILEPLVQGAAGMRLYARDFLIKLAQWAKSNHIYFIADEIMTGFGRTGEWLACDHAGVKPDFVCLSKGISSGTLPLSCVLIDHAVYALFYRDHSENKSFLHSHTYCGNAMAVAAALATIKALREERHVINAKELGSYMREQFEYIAATSGKLKNVRSLGAWVAGDLIESERPRMGLRVFHEAMRQGALLRPLGNTLYWLLPLTTEKKTIRKLAEITLNSIEVAYNSGQ